MTQRPFFPKALAWLAGILILASGCVDQSPTATILDPASVGAVTSTEAVPGLGISALVAPQPYEAGTTSKVITSSGGTIDFGVGSITFPAGAVSSPTRITATVDGETMQVEFGPHGLQFLGNAQPTLIFRYGGAEIPQTAAIYYVDPDGVILEDLGGIVDETSGTVTAWLAHFSPYILGAS